MKIKSLLTVSLVALVSFLTGAWLLQPGETNRTGGERLLRDVISYVSEYYVDEIAPADLYEMAADGMLGRLNDPYTSFLREEAFGALRLSTTGNYGGVGLQIMASDGWITVVTPLADTPGERAGIVSGDQIIAVDGESTRGWSVQQASGVMRGEPGSPVRLTVVRAGFPDTLEFTIERARVHVNSVEGPMVLAGTVGYLRVRSVSQSAPDELARTITQLHDAGARSLILDLRNNPGGVLEEGVALADLFLNRGRVVVETRGRAPGASRFYRASEPPRWPDLPLVVLVNGGTASAAEILSGALQDHRRAVILGTPTFGKGIAYVLIPLSESQAVSVTTSRWYTPGGRSIDRPRSGAGRPPMLASEQSDSTGNIDQPAGGIIPDVILAPDTLTTSEQQFARALGSKLPSYRDVLTHYALELKASNPPDDPDFDVTRNMIVRIRQMLEDRGVTLSDSTWEGSRRLVSEQFGYELTRYTFGRAAELRRTARNDNQIQRAVELLTRTSSVEELVSSVRSEP